MTTSKLHYRQLEVICNNASVALFIMDERQQCTYMNPAAEELTGYAFADVQGRPMHDVLHHTRPDGSPYPRHECPIHRAYPDNDREQGEETVIHRDGHFINVFYTASPIRDGGDIIGTVVEFQDISKLKRAEQDLQSLQNTAAQRHHVAETLKQSNQQLEVQVEERTQHLRASRERYRLLFDSMDDGFCVIELRFDASGRAEDYRFLEVNPAFVRHTGLRDAVGNWARALIPRHENAWFGILGRIAKSGKPRRFIHHADCLNGRWYEMYAFSADGGSHQLAVIFDDITERVHSEAKLRRAHGLLEGITAGTQDLIAAEDKDFRYLYFNEAYRKTFKHLWGRELEPGESMLEALAPWPEEQQKAKTIWTRALAGETYSITMEFGPSDQHKSVYELHFNPIRDAAGSIIGAAHILRDVTKEVHFQHALRESEERYRLIARSTNDVIWDWDLDKNLIEWNVSALTKFGWKPENLRGGVDTWHDNIHPDDLDRVVRGIQQAINSGEQSWSEEYRFRNSDGQYSIYFDRGHVARDPSGRPYRMIGSMLDLTARRQAEEALRRAAEADAFRITLADALRPLANPLEIQTIASRVLGRHLNANRVHYATLSNDGRHAHIEAEYRAGVSSLLGEVDLDDYGPGVMEELRAGMTLVIDDVSTHSRLRESSVNANAFSVSAYIIVPLIKNGAAVAALIVSHAVPRNWTDAEVALSEETAERTWAAVERARIENALRDSEQRFRLLTDGIPHIVWLADSTGHYEFLNRQFSSYTGAAYTPVDTKEFVERFVHPDDIGVTLTNWQQALKVRQAFFVEQRIRAANGTYSWFAARAEPHIDGSTGEILRWFGTMTNIQERKLAERTLREADRQKDEFIAMLAHELRNPLAAVRNVERLLAPAVADDADAQRYVEILRRQTGTLSELVEELLDVSRVTRGLVDLKKERVGLAQVASDALESVQVLMEEKQHQTRIELPGENLTVIGDAVRLEQILVNLLTNAAKYTDAGGHIRLCLTRQGGFAELQVQDDGIGMTQEEIERVFTLFGQAERGLDRAQGGLGIGLTVVKNLVELHGGEIDGKSSGLGMGAVFTVRLPLAPAAVKSSEQVSPAEELPGSNKRVLLVEDSSDVADTMALLLEAAGHQVTVAGDGPAALALAERERFDVILLDIGLPGMDGYEVARCLQQHTNAGAAVLVALTGYGQARDKAQAEEAGFDAHFVKPVDINSLQKFIQHA